VEKTETSRAAPVDVACQMSLSFTFLSLANPQNRSAHQCPGQRVIRPCLPLSHERRPAYNGNSVARPGLLQEAAARPPPPRTCVPHHTGVPVDVGFAIAPIDDQGDRVQRSAASRASGRRCQVPPAVYNRVPVFTRKLPAGFRQTGKAVCHSW